jgi:chromosome segregation ATPase
MRIQLLEMQKHECEMQKQDQATSLRSAELELSACQAQLYDIRAKMEMVSEKGGAFQLQNAELECTNARLLQRVQESNELTSRLQQQLNSSCDQAMEWHEHRTVLQKQVAGLQADLKSAQLALSEITAAHADVEMQLRATVSQLEAERGAHGGTAETLQSVQSQLDYVKRNSDAMRAQTQDALKRARDAEELCEEMSSQFASLRDDVKHKSQQASDAKLAMERAQRTSSDSLFALQQDCGKLEGECQVLRERARDLEEQAVKQKAQIHELVSKLAAARKAESTARAQAETNRAHADLSLPSPSSSSIAIASSSAGAVPPAIAGLPSQSVVLSEVQHAGNASRGESSASADRASILGNLANGLTEEAQKRILSRLVMATRKVYRSGNKAVPRQDLSEDPAEETASAAKENIQP